MSENEGRRRGRVLSPEAKWEVFLQVTSREMSQAEVMGGTVSSRGCAGR